MEVVWENGASGLVGVSTEPVIQAGEHGEKETPYALPVFKARVAKEALKGIKPVHEIASESQIHPVQASQ